ncbi:MAG TPA: TonB-dependent receptor [Lentimicrobium sp.]|nr:TonB-dependent receptor [Lentimicrobium sp.]
MIRRILLVLLVFGPVMMLYAQTGKVTGRVTDAEKGTPLPSALVRIGTQQTTSRTDGTFELQRVATGEAVIDFSLNGYEDVTLQVKVSENLNLGDVKMKAAPVSDLNAGLAEISLASLDSDDDAKSQNISGLLSSSNDVFVAAASYAFSSAYFRMRGYDADLNSTYISGSPINDAETGRTLWALWGGLNDATRNKVNVNGIAPAGFSFGNIGGVTNIITRASQQRPQTKITYSMTNRTYTNRLMVTHSTGLMDNNWAVTLSASRRWGQEGFVQGTYYDAYSWFLGLEKKFNDKHSIAFTALDAPVKRGMQGGSTQEVYNLTGNNYYNPNWGYQNGEVRNARIRTMNQPLMILNHFWKPNDKTQVTTTASYLFGKTSTSALNWYNANDPRPDYYRYLPSYYPVDPKSPTDPSEGYYLPMVSEQMAQNWQNDPSVSQINWNRLYQVNYLSNVTGEQAHYVVEDRHNDQSQINLSSFINHELNDKIKISGGIEYSAYTGSYYKILEDLLGGNYWVDIDQFAARDFIGNQMVIQNDLNNPNRIVKEGDKYGYDYKLHQNSGNLWGIIQVSSNKLDYYAGLQLTTTSFYREGLMRNGRFPENSYGKSDKTNFFDYAGKAGVTYKITGRHFVEANLTYMTRAPYMRNAYISPRVRDEVVPNLTSEKIFSSELSYHLRAPMIKARLTAYHTMFKDQSEVTAFYLDGGTSPGFVNSVQYGMDRIHQGIEAGAEVKLNSAFSLVLAGNLGNYRYTNRPTSLTSYENGILPDTTETIYTKYFYVPGTPQTACSFALKYSGPKYLFVEASVNYYDNIYLDFHPQRRTPGSIANLGEGNPLIKVITQQEKLPNGYTIDASIGKSFRFYNKYYLNINFSISNILDNQKLITGGYEQSRFDGKAIYKFPSKYYYGYGRTYFLNLGFRF